MFKCKAMLILRRNFNLAMNQLSMLQPVPHIASNVNFLNSNNATRTRCLKFEVSTSPLTVHLVTSQIRQLLSQPFIGRREVPQAISWPRADGQVTAVAQVTAVWSPPTRSALYNKICQAYRWASTWPGKTCASASFSILRLHDAWRRVSRKENNKNNKKYNEN